jgi:hypothetical protein
VAVKVVMNASSPQVAAVAPVARSVAALLRAEGVPTADLDDVFAILSDEDLFPPDQVPQNLRECSEQVQRAYSIFLRNQLTVVEASPE